jgi:hypothetical protein
VTETQAVGGQGDPAGSAELPATAEAPAAEAPSMPGKAPDTRRTPVVRDLARRVRASRALSGSAKRQWLKLLPHLREEDRARLDAILGEGSGQR